jgi:ABC-type thiamin/hydroxymethylpyrimidine transport system permease subunit
MIEANQGSMVLMPPAATATNASQYASFKRDGHDQANIMVIIGTHTTTTAVVTGLKISESDTVTSASSMTDIAALCASNTTSTSAVNSVPAGAVQGLGAIVEFQIDLRKRKKYIGISVLADTVATAVIAVLARLTRSKESADTAAQKSLPLNLAATSVVSCAQIIAG